MLRSNEKPGVFIGASEDKQQRIQSLIVKRDCERGRLEGTTGERCVGVSNRETDKLRQW